MMLPIIDRAVEDRSQQRVFADAAIKGAHDAIQILLADIGRGFGLHFRLEYLRARSIAARL
jgi:hypothetical protein